MRFPKRTFPKLFLLFCIGAVSVSISGCVTNGVSVSRLDPPRNPAAASLKRVAVLPFDGPHAQQTALEFESMLAQANLNGQAYFSVLDRRTLDNALREMKLQTSGLVDPKTVARLGKFVGVDGIYTGTEFSPPVQTQSFSEQRSECTATKDPKKLISKCVSSRNFTVSCVRRVATFTMVPRLVKVETAQVIYQPTITATRETASCNDSGAPGVSDAEMVASARAEVFEKVRADVAPHVVVESVKLKSVADNLSGENLDTFKSGLTFANGNRMDRGCELWGSIESSELSSNALAFNLAVCREVSGDLDGALGKFDALDRRLKAPDPDVNAALLRVRDRIQARLHRGAVARSSDRAPQARVSSGNGTVIQD